MGDGVGSATDTCAPDGFPAPGVSVQFQIHNQGAVVGTKDNFAPNSSAIKDSAGEEMEVCVWECGERRREWVE